MTKYETKLETRAHPDEPKIHFRLWRLCVKERKKELDILCIRIEKAILNFCLFSSTRFRRISRSRLKCVVIVQSVISFERWTWNCVCWQVENPVCSWGIVCKKGLKKSLPSFNCATIHIHRTRVVWFEWVRIFYVALICKNKLSLNWVIIWITVAFISDIIDTLGV